VTTAQKRCLEEFDLKEETLLRVVKEAVQAVWSDLKLGEGRLERGQLGITWSRVCDLARARGPGKEQPFNGRPSIHFAKILPGALCLCVPHELVVCTGRHVDLSIVGGV
jgi:hypothetical protein